MTAHVKISGTWRTLTALHAKIGGTWREITNGYVKISGTWREFYANIRVALNASYSYSQVVSSPNNAFTGFRIHSDGTVDGTQALSLSWNIAEGTWLLSGAASDYEVRATVNSGAVTSGSATGSWLAATTDPAWVCSRTSVGIAQANLTVEIRLTATGEVLDSTIVDLYAEKQSGG